MLLNKPEYLNLFRWPCGLRRKLSVALFLGSQVRIPLRARMFVYVSCCVFCRQWPLRRADHPYRGVLTNLYNLETSTEKQPRPKLGCSDMKQNMEPFWCSQVMKRNFKQNTVTPRVTTCRFTTVRLYDGACVTIAYSIQYSNMLYRFVA